MPIQATCADCHAVDGRDLKYFNYSNRSIIERSKFHNLTQTEVALLRKLYADRERTVSREDLLRSVWNLGARSTRTLDTHIARLRKKLEPVPGEPQHLLTVHGIGYRLRLSAEKL